MEQMVAEGRLPMIITQVRGMGAGVPRGDVL